MRRVAAGLILCLFAGCGGGGAVHVIPRGELPAFYDVRVRSASRVLNILVFFVQNNRLAAVSRTTGRTSAPAAEEVMRQLLVGPTGDRETGLTTKVPAETELLGIRVDNQVATVDLSRDFERFARQDEFALRIAQIVFSLTELPDVDRVSFLLDGQPEKVIDQDGSPHDVVARGRYGKFAPQNADEPIVGSGPLVSDVEGSPDPTP